MAILVTRNKTFKVILQDKSKKSLAIDYWLNDTPLAEKWFNKIKHLQRVPVDQIESGICDLSDIHGIHRDFCDFANIDYRPIQQQITQEDCNFLHKLYEDNHNELSRKKNNAILYKFHHAIHNFENQDTRDNKITVGWGINEGPLTENYLCNPSYDDYIIQNNLYLPWSELGKTPIKYWANNEQGGQVRFNELCKPHITLRAKFFIAVDKIVPKKFSKKFEEWFEQYKTDWLSSYNLESWSPIDEDSAPLLAVTDCKEDLTQLEFKSISID